MEGDKSHCTSKIIPGYFNPLPPHGGRLTSKTLDQLSSPFQSTPSAWRETAVERIYHNVNSFQSTPSAWRETLVLGLIQDVCSISIHSLRMEGDWTRLLSPIRQIYFNPLPPHGGRLCKRLHCNPPNTFQSTPSAWRETERNGCATIPLNHFNPLPPHGGRLDRGVTSATVSHFNPLPPHGGRLSIQTQIYSFHYFNPLPPHGGRPADRPKRSAVKVFQSTPSAWRETSRETVVPPFPSTISIHSLRMEGDSR